MTTAPHPGELLDDILRNASLPRDALPEFLGHDPVFPTPFRVGAAGAVSLAAVGAAISALWTLRTGRGQCATIDVRHAAAAMRSTRYVRLDGEPPRERVEPVSGIYPVRDGHIYLHCSFPHHEERAIRRLGVAANRAEVARAVRDRDAAALEEAIIEAGGVAAHIRTFDEWRAHPQFRALDAVPLVDIARIGDAPPQPLPPGPRPLSGIRALDVTRVLAGPTASRTLAEHGADVLKIAGPHQTHPPDGGAIELDTGLGKLSAALDLRKAADRDRLTALVRAADVFVQSFRPGALADKGFSPEVLAKLRPGLIYVTLSAWGHEGPWRNRRGFDSVVQAVSGIAAASGKDGTPRFMPVSAIDYVSGYLMAFGAMVALRRRALEGGSWHVRVALARVGKWIVEQGLLAPAEFQGSAEELPADELAPLLTETAAPAGAVQHIKPVLQLSETPGFWTRPPVPLGYSRAEWP